MIPETEGEPEAGGAAGPEVRSLAQDPRSSPRSGWRPAEGGPAAGLALLGSASSPTVSRPAPRAGSARSLRLGGGWRGAHGGGGGGGDREQRGRRGDRAQPRPARAAALAHPRPAWGARGARSARRPGPRTPAQERGRGAAERSAWSRPASPPRGSGRRRPPPPAPRPPRPGRARRLRRRAAAPRGCCGDRGRATRAAPAGRRPWRVSAPAALHPRPGTREAGRSHLGRVPERTAERDWDPED